MGWYSKYGSRPKRWGRCVDFFWGGKNTRAAKTLVEPISCFFHCFLLSLPSSYDKRYPETNILASENGCLEYYMVSFWSKRPIFIGKMVVPLGWYPGCLTPQRALQKRIYPLTKYPLYKVCVMCIWGWLFRGPHPKGPPLFSSWYFPGAFAVSFRESPPRSRFAGEGEKHWRRLSWILDHLHFQPTLVGRNSRGIPWFPFIYRGYKLY